MTIYESSSKHNILMYKTFFSFSISHCMVSALIDCLQRPNTSLPPLNTRSIPTSADGNWKEIPHRLSYQGVCKRVHFPPLQYPFRRSLMGPTHRWRVDIFVDIRSNDRLGRLDFAECLSYRLRHSPDCAETVASNGYSLKKDRTSPMMCSASDSLICAAKKVVPMSTYCNGTNHLGVSR